METYNCLTSSNRLPSSGRRQQEQSSRPIDDIAKIMAGDSAPPASPFGGVTPTTAAASAPTSPCRASVACNSIDASKNQRSSKKFKKNKQKVSQSYFKKPDTYNMSNLVIYNSSLQDKDKRNTINTTPDIEPNPDSTVEDTDPNNEVAPHKKYKHKLFITGYAPYVRADDLVRACSRFGPAHCERRTVRAAVVGFTSVEHAEAAVRAAARGLLFVYGAPLKAHFFVPDRDQVAPPKQKERPLAVPPVELQLSGNFREQAEALLARVRLTREEVERLVRLYADVERALSAVWPRCRAVPFGSITTGLGTKDSDADCFVEVPGGAPNNAVNRARRPLQQFSQIFLDVIAIPRANTPIVKLLHVPTNTKCDLSFKTPLGVLNSRLLAHLLHRAPVLPRLAVLIKYWAGVHGLSGTGRVTNYALVLLLIHYLQRCEPPVLPPVELLQRNRAFTCFVDNWNAGFDENAAPPIHVPRDEDLPELLDGFFEYYATFEFDRYVVSPYLGGPLLREMFSRPEALPDEFALYRNNVLEGIEPGLRIETPWCVQDPFVHCHNVASGVNAQFAADLIAFIRYAAAACVEERADSYRGVLRRLLCERPQLARRATIALFNVHLKPPALKAAGPDWRARVRRATHDIFERIFGATLHDQRHIEDKKGRECEECTARFERYLWKRRKQRRPRGAADMPFLEREIATTEALVATAPLMPPVSLQLTVKLGPVDKHSATVSVRLVEGDVVAFRDFGNYFISVCQSWYAKLLGLEKETIDDSETKNERNVDGEPHEGASDDHDAGDTQSDESTSGALPVLGSETPTTPLLPSPRPVETEEAHSDESPTNPPLKIFKMDDIGHVEK